MLKQKIKTIVADDEESLRVALVRKLQRDYPMIEICGEASNGSMALNLIRELKPEVVFLDIKMPELSGIEVARQITHVCKVVFVTAYDQYAVKAFESNAIDYLLKPVADERLQQCVQRIAECIGRNHKQTEKIDAIHNVLMNVSQKQPEKLTWINVSVNNITRMICVDDVLYFHAEDKYTIVHSTDKKKYLISKAVKELERELDQDHFWRIHRSTIVNAHHIDHIVKDERGNRQVKLKNSDHILNVSRAHVNRFKHM